MFFKNFFFRIFYILFLIIIITLSFATSSFAAYPKLVSTLISAFEKIKSWIISISTPAVAVAVRYWCVYEEI